MFPAVINTESWSNSCRHGGVKLHSKFLCAINSGDSCRGRQPQRNSSCTAALHREGMPPAPATLHGFAGRTKPLARSLRTSSVQSARVRTPQHLCSDMHVWVLGYLDQNPSELQRRGAQRGADLHGVAGRQAREPHALNPDPFPLATAPRRAAGRRSARRRRAPGACAARRNPNFSALATGHVGAAAERRSCTVSPGLPSSA